MKEDLPPTLSSMWRLCKLGLRFEPRLMLQSFGLFMLAALPDALLALWFKLIADGVVRQDSRLVLIAVMALAVSVTASWFLRIVSWRKASRDSYTCLRPF